MKARQTLAVLAIVLVWGVWVTAEPALGQPAPGKATTQPTTRPKPGANAPAFDSLMNSMLKPASPDQGRVLVPLPDPPKYDPATGKTIAPNPPTPPLMREGSPVLDRTGRITTGADGQHSEFTFDADGKNMLDPPMIILPNLSLMAMENMVSSTNKDVKFHVSGTVTEYKGRNYILIEKATAVHDATQQF